ncbi:alginate export family protein [Eudoraea chungangensis]|uniref:alginate export family protein n=1 Tax=Eudoraea chungangensis TaxID=1481905 RepID=UPI0023EC4C1F|nr:alginate export family protein [Eudoraea chungangensis]
MKKSYFVLCLIWLFTTQISAQFKLDAEIRPRFEYRHGFGTLFPNNADPSGFVSQRTRLNTTYQNEYLHFYVSVQDIRVWGDVPQLNKADNNGLGLFQAWGEILFSNEMSLRLGRQAVDLDDQRIFGSVAWAQQARSHDMALFKYQKNNHSLQLGAAYNQDGESNTGNLLTVQNTYKTLQYGWYHRNWDKLAASFLFLNNGQQYTDTINADNNTTRFSQTLGTHLKSNNQKLGWWANLYYQFGNDVNSNRISAYLIALEGSYKLNPKFSVLLGGEVLSGNDGGAPTDGKNKAFAPLYGTNHKFNGLMDYFYVGNHANNVGLFDLYLGANIGLGEKSSLYARIHNFSSAADLVGTEKKQLGVEADFVYTYKFKKDIILNAGYSQLFAAEGMEVLKNNFDGNANYWGWVMLTIKPTLYQSK